MRREKIILSDLDLKILVFIRNEIVIKEIVEKFDISYSLIKKHIDRLKEINLCDSKKYGTFLKLKINERGRDILNIIQNENNSDDN